MTFTSKFPVLSPFLSWSSVHFQQTNMSLDIIEVKSFEYERKKLCKTAIDVGSMSLFFSRLLADGNVFLSITFNVTDLGN